jgi:hypothetical protein
MGCLASDRLPRPHTLGEDLEKPRNPGLVTQFGLQDMTFDIEGISIRNPLL